MPNENQEQDFLSVSDEEFLNGPMPQGNPPAEPAENTVENQTLVENPEPEVPENLPEAVETPEVPETVETPETTPNADPTPETPEGVQPPAPSGAEGGENPEGGEGNETPSQETPTEVDYKGFYESLIGAPIKANGREITLKSPEEALRLIQMGANYTKKMQVLQPSLRVVKMLENNKLLDEKKLSFLIDLDKGNPQAIQKFLQEKNFDPTTVDEEVANQYQPSNHQVGDAEWQFNQVLDDVESTETGPELLNEIHQQWDKESKQAVFQDPTILHTLNAQKAQGLYQQITQEMDRQAALGYLNGVPFLQAYRAVGEMLAQNGSLKPKMAPPPAQQAPIETRTVVPPKPAGNDDRARRAGPTRGTAPQMQTEVNLLELPDEEFLKQMQGRL